MIRGKVSGGLARVSVTFFLPDGNRRPVTCIVDTGFEGALTLPKNIIEALGLPLIGDSGLTLADASFVEADAHYAPIEWDKTRLNAAVFALETAPLLGTALLENYQMAIDFTENGDVVIQRRR